MKGIKLGEMNTMKVVKEVDFGMYLDGGDCIVAPDGQIRIIDFNDWPSFAPCRTEAAPSWMS